MRLSINLNYSTPSTKFQLLFDDEDPSVSLILSQAVENAASSLPWIAPRFFYLACLRESGFLRLEKSKRASDYAISNNEELYLMLENKPPTSKVVR